MCAISERFIQCLPYHNHSRKRAAYSKNTRAYCALARRSGRAPTREHCTNSGTEVVRSRVGRGLYRLASAPPLTSPDLVTVALRAPLGVVCLRSALSHHGLTTQIPHAIDVAFPSHAQVPRIEGIPLRIFWYSQPSYSAGVETFTAGSGFRPDPFAASDPQISDLAVGLGGIPRSSSGRL